MSCRTDLPIIEFQMLGCSYVSRLKVVSNIQKKQVCKMILNINFCSKMNLNTFENDDFKIILKVIFGRFFNLNFFCPEWLRFELSVDSAIFLLVPYTLVPCVAVKLIRRTARWNLHNVFNPCQLILANKPMRWQRPAAEFTEERVGEFLLMTGFLPWIKYAENLISEMTQC